MEPVVISFSAVLLMGLAFGAGPCTVTCLPYLGPVFVARGGGVRQAWRTVLPFSLGRITGYALLGAAAGAAGQVAVDGVAQGSASLVLGAVTVALGVLLWRRAGSAPRCATPVNGAQPGTEQGVAVQRHGSGMPSGLFGLGAAMALNPCLPLGAVLLAAATTAQPLAGFSLGLAFGLGAVVIPALILGTLVAHLGSELRAHLGRWRPRLERSAGAMLMVLGGVTAMGWIQP